MAKTKDEFTNIKYILTSSMRTKLILTVYKESKNLDQLRKDLDKPSATILHGLKELEAINLIRKSQKKYELTSNGYLLATNMRKLIENWYSIDKNSSYWNNHDLNSIPNEMLKKVYLLKDCEYIHSTTSDLSNAFNNYIKLLSSASDLKIILPIYSEIHFKHIIQLLNKNKIEKLDLIMNLEILNSIKKNQKFKKEILNNSKVNVKTIKTPLKLFLTISENFMSLTLFFKDGHYDDSEILIGKTEAAITWAEELFSIFQKIIVKEEQ